MCADTVVGHAGSNPYGTLAPGSLADKVHYPHFVGVANREGLTAGGIAVFGYEGGHAVNRLAGSLAALQRDVDKAAVVYSDGVFQLVATAPCSLANGELVLVHIAHHSVGVRHLRDLA